MLRTVLVVVPPITNPEGDGLLDPTRPDFETWRLASPIEPLTVISDLEKRGFTCHFFDLGATEGERWPAFRQIVEQVKPDVVLVSQAILTFVTAMDWDGNKVFDIARDVVPDVVTILTGNHATNYPGQAVRDGRCGYSLRGETDDTVGQLLSALRDGGDLSSVVGLSYVDGAGTVQVSEEHPQVDLSHLPLPAYHVLDQHHQDMYAKRVEKGKIRFPEKSTRYRDIMTARGCVLRCSFCSVSPLRGPKQKFRRKPLSLVIDEIRQALDQGIEEIHFFDDLFASSEQEILDFCDAIQKANLKFPWFVAQGMPLWPLTERALTAMAEAGLYRLIAPFETGSERVLHKVVGKVYSSIEHHHNVARWARALDLELIGLFVIGLPGETRGDVLETLRFAAEHPEIDYSVFSIATPLVGTKLMRQVTEQNKLSDPTAINRVIKRTVALFESEDFESYELGVIRTYDWDRINFSTPERRAKYARMVGLTLEELDSAREDSVNVFKGFFPHYEGPKSFFELADKPGMFGHIAPVIPDKLYS